MVRRPEDQDGQKAGGPVPGGEHSLPLLSLKMRGGHLSVCVCVCVCACVYDLCLSLARTGVTPLWGWSVHACVCVCV